MSLFRKNPNEVNYSGGKKHFVDVIKNTGPGELLIWLNAEEDFNTNSTLIVAESEEALFFKDGIIEQVFDGGKYTLSTNNYPFISRLRNTLSGGISTFNCKVYFVRKSHSLEILWGTDSPIQVRDPELKIATSVQARGSFKIQVENSKKFLLKLVGNNVSFMSQQEITHYFRNEFIQHIKSNIARSIRESNQEILGICAEQDLLAEKIFPILQEPLNDYGIKLLNFIISAIDIPENDPNRQRLEAAYAAKTEAKIYDSDYGRFVAREVLTDIANNPGAGGVASAGAGLGLGMGAAPIIGSMAQQIFTPMQQSSMPENKSRDSNISGRFVQKTDNTHSKCPNCGATNSKNAKFCSECGGKINVEPLFCENCGAEMLASSKFCSECGAKI